MVDIPLLRKRAAELAEGRLSRDGAAICLNAALDEIEELRAENERTRFVLDQMDGDAMEADHDLKEMRTVLSELVTLKFDRPDDYEERKPKAWAEARRVLTGFNCCESCGEKFTPSRKGMRFCSVRCANRARQRRYHQRKTMTVETATDCLDCGIGPCATDPTSVTSATPRRECFSPRCYQRGYCGEPGQMSRPQVSALVDGQPYPLWDAVQMKAGEDR